MFNSCRFFQNSRKLTLNYSLINLRYFLSHLHKLSSSLHICTSFNPFMHNIVKWANILWKSCGVHTTRFLKCVWPFYNIMHETVKGLKKYIRVEMSRVNFAEHIIVNLFRYWKYTYIYHCSDLISQDLISQCRSSNEINVYQPLVSDQCRIEYLLC